MSIIVPFSSPTMLFTTLSTEYFGATMVVLTLLLFCCGFLIYRKQKKGGNGKGVFLYLAMLLLMSLLFAVVSIKDEQNDYYPVSVTHQVNYDLVTDSNRINVYEHFSD